MQATESSTGARHDIDGIAKIVREQGDALLVVDAITGLGTTHLDVDRWGVDVIIGGSQKALMMPPGPGVLCGQRARVEAHGDYDVPSLLF